MGIARLLSIIGPIALSIILTTPFNGYATIGLAEWQVNTPGGNVIRHQDGWKDQHGDCLTSNERDANLSQSEKQKVYVSHLERWRYYSGYVAGASSKQGYFLFDEESKHVLLFETEDDLKVVLNEKGITTPLSPWLTGGDGWSEAWFFDFVWRPCQVLRRGGAVSEEEARYLKASGMTKKKCVDTITPELLKLYSLTSWGQGCSRWKDKFKRLDQERNNQREGDLLDLCYTLERGGFSIEEK